MFEDDILLKLRRKYSKDETVALLNKEFAASQVEIGELKSEVAHLTHELKEREGLLKAYNDLNKAIEEKNKELKALRSEVKDSLLYKSQLITNQTLKQDLKRARETNMKLITELVKLKNPK